MQAEGFIPSPKFVVVPRSLDISEPVLPPLETLPDLLRGGEADQWDEGLGSREAWEDHRGWVDPDRSHGLLEKGEFILGFLLLGVRARP